jgi:hypothetical protein
LGEIQAAGEILGAKVIETPGVHRRG